MHIANHNDVDMSIVSSMVISIPRDSVRGTSLFASLAARGEHEAQILTVRVTSVVSELAPFYIRLNSLDFQTIQDKLTTTIRNAQSIVIAQSLSDRFVEAFTSIVQSNPMISIEGFNSNSDQDRCAGCMSVPPQVKISQRCAVPTPCTPCYCRPMWCLTCLGKWFASKQNPDRVQHWLNGTAPCPTCRATFCLLDVRRVASSWEISNVSM